jgi:hypothetical protein
MNQQSKFIGSSARNDDKRAAAGDVTRILWSPVNVSASSTPQHSAQRMFITAVYV